MKATHKCGCGDLTVNEALHDPLTRIMMRADGVRLHDFALLLAEVGRRLAAERAECPKARSTRPLLQVSGRYHQDDPDTVG